MKPKSYYLIGSTLIDGVAAEWARDMILSGCPVQVTWRSESGTWGLFAWGKYEERASAALVKLSRYYIGKA